MRLPSPRTLAVVLADVLLLAVSIAHIPALMDRPWIPFRVEPSGGRVVVQNTDPNVPLEAGEAVLAWEGMPIHAEHDMEFLAESRRIGDRVVLTAERDGMRREVTLALIPAYSLRYVVITTVVGLVTWCIAVFVILARPRQRTAAVLHWSLICMGMGTMLMLGRVESGGVQPYIARALFFATYAGVAAFFLHFTFLFPVPHPGLRRKDQVLLYLVPGAMAVLLFLFNARAIHRGSLADYGIFDTLYDLFHLLLVLYVFWGLWNFIRAYAGTREPDERKKLKWLLWGLSIGPVPFLVLITIPEFVVTTSPVPEEFTLLPLVVIPLAFAISFIRYHVLDIEIVIHRTTVYSIVLALLAIVYAGAVWVATLLVGAQGVGTTALAAAVVGLAFEPARRWVQHAVDRIFFQVRYDFRRTERRFVEEIRHTYDPAGLAALMATRIEEVIPVDRLAFLAFTGPEGRPKALTERGFEVPPASLFDLAVLEKLPDLPAGIRSLIEAGVRIDESDEQRIRGCGAALAFAMKARDGTPLGVLLLGRKRSGARFAAEDVDLLSNVCAQAALVLERVMLHGALIRKQTETERLQVLNEMQSEFVSNVSHELRTPLTSIKMFTELLRSGGGSGRSKGQEYLGIIQEEAGRLDRLVSTVLDAGQIERGAKTYTLTSMDLAEAVRDAFATMRYQLVSNGFTSSLIGCSPLKRCIVEADRDAVVQAVINLMGNAIKYSVARRRVRVSLVRGPSACRVSVADRGEGIPPESMERLFQRFFRDPGTLSRIQGLGIGLAVVKHIMDAHGGTVEVKSVPGKGSTFTLVFPVHADRTGRPRRTARRTTKGRR
jgi:signal transduction histidine kinase